jgi:peptidyl-prolyl cis-trans isomerase SurA
MPGLTAMPARLAKNWTRSAPLAFACLLAGMLPMSSVGAASRPGPGPTESVRIVAVVNASVVTNIDVDNRARLFAVTASLPQTPEVLGRLKPQITRELIDERLRMQDVERQHIVVQDKQVAAAIAEIEQRNGMSPGALRAKLDADGVSFTTLVDEVRTEIGWTLLLRRELGGRLRVTPADVAAQQRIQAAEVGRPEYRVGEIFIPVENPANAADAHRFADTVIKELRIGAPFAVVAAQFSESQTALQGGDLGWVQPNQLDPGVAQVVQEMPTGAVSEPITVPGGLAIVTLAGKREIGHDMATMLSIRQVFLPFDTTLNPSAPTAKQMATLKKAQAISARVRSCPEMESVAAENHSSHPANPGDVRLDAVNPPQFRAMLASQPLDRATRPLVSNDGIAVMMICSRDEKNLDELSRKQIEDQILQKRVELLSRQLQQDLRRQASIDLRIRTGTA